ncbi:hypothetical protein EVAR_85873_1 [Eumeta japonica]|uniref:Uncharacterized protein n=1 Tax=Eumeta variegata TaxID=151549 RepID=A0A4C2A6E1_EUMVA|nr:hypothetical protein EVAR_85873_1 [Eumeta japonica]
MILAGLLHWTSEYGKKEALYKAKRIIDGLSSTEKLEKDIANTERPHPAKAMSIEYELIDESDPDPWKNCRPANLHDGSKINGRVGAAITWWTNDTESEYQTSVYILHAQYIAVYAP